MSSETRTPAQMWILRIRLVNLMARRHRITRKLANWHVAQMADAQVVEEWDRYQVVTPQKAEASA